MDKIQRLVKIKKIWKQFAIDGEHASYTHRRIYGKSNNVFMRPYGHGFVLKWGTPNWRKREDRDCGGTNP